MFCKTMENCYSHIPLVIDSTPAVSTYNGRIQRAHIEYVANFVNVEIGSYGR